MAQFPNQNKLPIFRFNPLFDFNVIVKFRSEASASTSASSNSPVILLQKLSRILIPQWLESFIVDRYDYRIDEKT
jgi:hypothetical protein